MYLEGLAANRSAGHQVTFRVIKSFKKKLLEQLDAKLKARKEGKQTLTSDIPRPM